MEKTDNWKAFGGKYIRADEVANNTDQYVVKAVSSEEEGDKITLILTLEREGITKLFGCNATNEQAVKAECPKRPKQVIGRVIVFNKVKATNPQTKKIVDGLRIQFVNDSGVNEDGTI